MALRKIVIYPDPLLHVPCDPVGAVDKDVQQLLDDMLETMYDANGIGLAAPQVGVSKRVIVVDVGTRSTSEESEDDIIIPSSPLRLVNPVIVEKDGEVSSEEGCLSIPDIRESVKRFESVTVEAVNENGQAVTIHADGLLAICLQHEIDHLDGILFIDRLSKLRKNLIRAKLRRLVDSYDGGGS